MEEKPKEVRKRKQSEEEKKPEPTDQNPEGDESKKDNKKEEDLEMTRLYVMNLSYEVTHDELKALFSKYGEIEGVEVPLRARG